MTPWRARWKAAIFRAVLAIAAAPFAAFRVARSGAAPALNALEPRSILFCRPDHIGDVLLSLPALAWVRARYPDAHIAVLAASWSAALFRGLPHCDELIVCDPPWWVRRRARRFGGGAAQGGWGELVRIVRTLRRRRFDLCIELRGDARQMLFFGVLAGAGRVISRDRHGGAALADSAPKIDERLHEIDQNMHVLTVLGAQPPGPTPCAPDLAFFRTFSDDDWQRVEHLLREAGAQPSRPFVVVHPGAKWANQWPVGAWRQLLPGMRSMRTELQFVLTGSPSEASLCEAAAAGMAQAFNMAGRFDLNGTAALMSRARLVVTGDTGPMHFLGAMDTPAVLLFGPTDPQRFAPRRARIRVVRAAACCQETLHETCLYAAPPQPSRCMASISAAEVLAAACELLGDSCVDASLAAAVSVPAST